MRIFNANHLLQSELSDMGVDCLIRATTPMFALVPGVKWCWCRSHTGILRLGP